MSRAQSSSIGGAEAWSSLVTRASRSSSDSAGCWGSTAGPDNSAGVVIEVEAESLRPILAGETPESSSVSLALADVSGNKEVNVSNCRFCICSMRSANWLKIAGTSEFVEVDWSVDVNVFASDVYV